MSSVFAQTVTHPPTPSQSHPSPTSRSSNSPPPLYFLAANKQNLEVCLLWANRQPLKPLPLNQSEQPAAAAVLPSVNGSCCFPTLRVFLESSEQWMEWMKRRSGQALIDSECFPTIRWGLISNSRMCACVSKVHTHTQTIHLSLTITPPPPPSLEPIQSTLCFLHINIPTPFLATPPPPTPHTHTPHSCWLYLVRRVWKAGIGGKTVKKNTCQTSQQQLHVWVTSTSPVFMFFNGNLCKHWHSLNLGYFQFQTAQEIKKSSHRLVQGEHSWLVFSLSPLPSYSHIDATSLYCTIQSVVCNC